MKSLTINTHFHRSLYREVKQAMKERGLEKDSEFPEFLKLMLRGEKIEDGSVVDFCEECLEFTGSHLDVVCNYGELYDLYCSWCARNTPKLAAIKKLYFKKVLIGEGYIVQTGSGNVIKVYGGKLIEDEDKEWEL